MIDPVVRAAVDGDLDEVRSLERMSRSAVAEHRGGVRWLETHPSHDGLPGGDLLVGTLDELVVGYLVLRVVDDVAIVDDVYVRPEARELGFGDGLLAAALVTARTRGARVLEAEALPGDRDTKNLYERAGITARLITVSTVL